MTTDFIPSLIPDSGCVAEWDLIPGYHLIAPSVSIVLSDYALTGGDSALITFTFSTPPSGFTVANVAAPNGTLSLFGVTGNARVYTALFTPNVGVVDATNVISVDANWTDGNGTTPLRTFESDNYTINTTAPTVAIASVESDVVGTAFICSFTLSSPSADFAIGDIVVGNGMAGTFLGSGVSYTCVVTPTATGIVTVDVPAGVFHDISGNANLAAAQFSILYVSVDLFIWAERQIYKDGGITVAANGDTVQQANDQSGNSRHALQAAPALQPTFILVSNVGGKPALRFVDHVLDTIPFLGAAWNTAFSIISVAYNASNAQMLLESNGGIGFEWLHRRDTAIAESQATAANLSDVNFQFPVTLDVLETAIEVFTYDGVNKYFSYNGVEISESAVNNLGLSGSLQIGRYSLGVQPWIGDIAVVILCKNLSFAQRKLIANTFNTHYGGVYRPSNLVFDGNSLTLGTGATPGNSYPEQVMSSFTKATRTNLAVGAQTTTQMEADAAATVDVLLKILYLGINVVCAWEITNELVSGVSAADAYTNFVTYCQNRRTAGFKVIVLTVLPRTTVNQAVFDAARATVNANIRANWATFADGLADVAADNRIGDDGDQNDATYYSDTTHLNDAGYAIVAGIVSTRLTALGA